MKKITALLIIVAIFMSMGISSSAAVIDGALEKEFFMIDGNYAYLIEETLVAEINNELLKVYNADGTEAAEKDFVKSGMICNCYGYKKTVILMGDVDCDGRVTAADARATLRLAAKLEDKDSPYCELAAHTEFFTDNGEIKARDARFILRCAARLADFANFEAIKAEKEKQDSKNEAKYEKNSLLIVVSKETAQDMSWVKEVVGCAYFKGVNALTALEKSSIYQIDLYSYDDFSLNKVIEALDGDSRVLLIEKNYVVSAK